MRYLDSHLPTKPIYAMCPCGTYEKSANQDQRPQNMESDHVSTVRLQNILKIFGQKLNMSHIIPLNRNRLVKLKRVGNSFGLYGLNNQKLQPSQFILCIVKSFITLFFYDTFCSNLLVITVKTN